MPSRTDTSTLLRYARIAGAGYLLIVVTGIFAEFVVRASLLVPGDPGATAANIAGSELFYRSGLAAEFVMLCADVVVALALYMIFEGVSRGLALMAAFFRLAHAAVVGANLLNVYVPLLLLGGSGALGLEAAQRDGLVTLYLDAHAYGYAIGLVFFGVYCGLIGYLILRSGYVPKVLGVLMMAAALGYLVDSFARTLMPNYADYENILGMVVLLPAFIGELSLSLWLLVKGVKVAPASP